MSLNEQSLTAALELYLDRDYTQWGKKKAALRTLAEQQHNIERHGGLKEHTINTFTLSRELMSHLVPASDIETLEACKTLGDAIDSVLMILRAIFKHDKSYHLTDVAIAERGLNVVQVDNNCMNTFLPNAVVAYGDNVSAMTKIDQVVVQLGSTENNNSNNPSSPNNVAYEVDLISDEILAEVLPNFWVRFFRVVWHGFPLSEATWEPAYHVWGMSCKEALDNWFALRENFLHCITEAYWNRRVELAPQSFRKFAALVTGPRDMYETLLAKIPCRR